MDELKPCIFLAVSNVTYFVFRLLMAQIRTAEAQAIPLDQVREREQGLAVVDRRAKAKREVNIFLQFYFAVTF